MFTEGNGGRSFINRTVAVGQDITLSCEVNATPTSSLSLSYNSSVAVSNVNLTSGSFIITNVDKNNEGQYTCQAENDVGIRELVHILNVKEGNEIGGVSQGGVSLGVWYFNY